MFAAYLLIFKYSGKEIINSVMLAALIRITAIVFFPTLSDDFYRFHWDGLIFTQGISPYEFTPGELMASGRSLEGIDQSLYSALNSPDYHSVYPPLSQFIFAAGAFFYPNDLFASMIVMKSILVLFELGSFFLLLRLLQHFDLDSRLSLLYLWNPLILIEGVSNMHFEVALVFFLLLFVYLHLKEKLLPSALALAGAILVKLTPLLLLPLIILKLKLRKSLLFLLTIIICSVLLFLPFYSSQGVNGFFSSIDLYFRVFEFNASLYYFSSHIGQLLVGYNPIQVIGPSLSILSTLCILFFSWKWRNRSLLFAIPLLMSLQLLFATTVHPWYILPIIAFGILNRFRYWMLWSLLIFLSYAAYMVEPVNEQLWFVSFEYLSVFGMLIWELRSSDKFAAD